MNFSAKEFAQDGRLLNEIKIAEIVEMRCEEAEENNFYCFQSEGEFKAIVVEAEDDEAFEDLDDNEVACLTKLMNSQEKEAQGFQKFAPSIYVDMKQHYPMTKEDSSNIKLVVQDYDTGAEETDGELPDLDTFDTWGWEDDPELPVSTRAQNIASTQASIIYNKSATFPRQTQKFEDLQINNPQVYYQGKSIRILSRQFSS